MKKFTRNALAAVTALTLLLAAAAPVLGWAVDQKAPELYTCADDDWANVSRRW